MRSKSADSECLQNCVSSLLRSNSLTQVWRRQKQFDNTSMTAKEKKKEDKKKKRRSNSLTQVWRRQKQSLTQVWRRQKQFVDTSMAATEIKNDDINKRGRKMIRVGIIGATGYAGGELVRILLNHKDAKIVWYGSRSYIDKKYYQVYQNMFQLVEDICKDDNLEELAKQVDVIFTATPQGFLAGLLTEEILSQVKIVDLSADYRIKDVATYEKWYGIEHKSPQFIEEAVYGLCEINRDKITEKTRLVANPGCYTTCSILTAYPMVKEGMIDVNTLIVDAKSGTSGAGRGAKVPNLFCEVNENMKAYGVASHRHTPEIEEQLGYAGNCQVTINFTPHLVPMNRGILATEYATLKRKPDGTLPTYEEVKAVYDKYYANEKFVRVLDKGSCPETKWVEGSNYVDINFVIDERTGRIIMMGALDNLVKGAAGQAVQNMNLLFGLPESEGLELVPCFP